MDRTSAYPLPVDLYSTKGCEVAARKNQASIPRSLLIMSVTVFVRFLIPDLMVVYPFFLLCRNSFVEYGLLEQFITLDFIDICMMFRSNRDIAVGVNDLSAAIEFYEDTLGFTPMKSQKGLRVYDTGYFSLYVMEGESHPPVPSYTVTDLVAAKKRLVDNGCMVIVERENSLYFRDPMGVVWDIIEKD